MKRCREVREGKKRKLVKGRETLYKRARPVRRPRTSQENQHGSSPYVDPSSTTGNLSSQRESSSGKHSCRFVSQFWPRQISKLCHTIGPDRRSMNPWMWGRLCGSKDAGSYDVPNQHRRGRLYESIIWGDLP